MGHSASGFEAFRWTSGSGMVGLGDLPGGNFSSQARGVSADGSTVVGMSISSSGQEAFRWTSGGGMVGLRNPSGELFKSSGLGVSADGSTVVGVSNLGQPDGGEAFIWDQANGMRNLREVLINDFSLNLTGWTLTEASGISDDGLTIVGWGNSPSGPQAWIAVIREPATPGDFDGDDDVDGTDFGLWQSGYPTASGAALGNGDADGDGDVDGADFGIWQANYPTNVGSAATIPEPTTLGLLLIGGLALLRGRRKL